MLYESSIILCITSIVQQEVTSALKLCNGFQSIILVSMAYTVTHMRLLNSTGNGYMGCYMLVMSTEAWIAIGSRQRLQV